MKYLSVCSGIEAATSAWHHLGWEPVAFSEIDPFPSAVLKHHYPTVPNLGDMSKFKEWNLGAIDLLVGGTPCQSFSVAGLRKGLDDPRGNLMLTFGAIARHFAPRWLVWENVPGVLSSNGGRDFGTFLGMLGELGYGFAYRVLDAQYFGVAQRRRRVFVVGCLGNWRLAAAVLFELASLSGNPPPRRETGKGSASGSAAGPQYGGSNQNTADTVTSKWAKGSGGPAGNECGLFVAQPVDVPDVMSTLLSSTAGVSRPGNAATEHETYIPMVFGVGEQPDVGHCLRSQASKADKHESTTYVAQPINIYGGNKRKDRPDGGFYVRMDEDTTKTLDAASGLNPTCSQGGTAVLQPIPFRKSKRAQSADDDESWVDDGVANTINLFDQGDIRTTHAVVQPIVIRESGQGYWMEDDIAGTLRAEGENRQSRPSHVIGQPIAWDEELNATVDMAGTLLRGGQGGRRDGVMAFSSNMSVPDCQIDVSPTLKLGGQGGNPPAIAFNGDQSEKTRSMGESLDHTPTLRADGPCHVAQPIGFDSYNNDVTGDVSKTIDTGQDYHHVPNLLQNMAVRRLTPRECERLQGFPDDHTLIPWRGKPAQACPDGPRYKALGNSMAVPVMRWIGERIRMIDELPK